MTTFTMQDLTPTKTEQATQLMEANGMTAPTQINSMEVTQEEEEMMQALTEKQKEQLAQHQQAHQMIQSVMGLQYTPMDTSPEAQSVSILVQQLTQTFNQLLQTLAHQVKTQQQQTEGLKECVDTVLQNAEWFKEMIEEKVEECIDGKDLDYEIESAVETYFSNSFSLDDHVNVEEEIERVVEEKLSNATISVDF